MGVNGKVQASNGLATLQCIGRGLAGALDPLSKVAQIGAVVIAAIWTFHMQAITGENEQNPEVWVAAQAIAYGKDTRLLLVRVREKNVGKVPVTFGANALTLVIKRVPDSLPSGYVDMDRHPALFTLKNLLKDETYLGAGAEFQDAAQFVVPVGTYDIEASLLLSDGDTVGDMVIQKVE
jgi:hypothetical protein